ncbi:MAG TPA: MBL fold metallo-hydrolase [Clostridiaceae bacterium]|nr:MBL fold metallo-hydrolase [Clostridiaceae bacterium]
MELYIAGGVGEHGRNCFYVEGSNSSFLVDCGVLASDLEDPYPRLTQQQIDRIDKVFLTHSHADHTAALPWLYKRGFRGRLIASDETLRQLPFDLSKNISLERICSNGEGFDKDLAIVWGRSGHCPGGVWYRFSEGGKSILFSGDYTEDTQVYVCDRIRGISADVAVIDCAYGKDEVSYDAACNRLISKTKEALTSHGILLFPVPRYGRGLELLKLFSNHLSCVNYFGDEIFLDQVEAAKQETFWTRSVNINVSLQTYSGEERGIVFVSNPQLNAKAARATAQEVLSLGGRAIATGTVEAGSFSATLIAEGNMDVLRYPIHLHYAQYLQLIQKNRFTETIAYHSAEFPQKRDRRSL